MDEIAAEAGGVGLDREVKMEEPLVQIKSDDVKPTYKSFKYVQPSNSLFRAPQGIITHNLATPSSSQ